MTKVTEILNHEAFWLAVSLILGYLGNSLASRGWVAKMAPTSPLKRAIRAFHGFINKIDPMILVFALTLPAMSGCEKRVNNVSAPTPIEAATMAVNFTDEALALAIEANPERDWKKSVAVVVVAADVVRKAGDICDALPELQLVASAIKCEKCFVAVATAKEALKCPN